MGANSLIRRGLKTALHPLLNETTYRYLQSVAKALDIRRGKWSEPELDLIPLVVRQGDVVLDLGANYGFYTYHLSRAVGPTGRVYAFEPVPFTFRTLQRVVTLLGVSGNVTLYDKGCSDRAGRVSFELPMQANGAPNAGQAYLAARNDDHAGAETQVRWARTVTVECDIVALDDFLPPLTRLSLIKCDIEGAELLAFRGAARLIDRERPAIICEINPWFLDGFGLRLEDLLDFFASRGYVLYRYTSEKRLRRVDAPAIVEDNYVFIPPERFSAFASVMERA